MWHAFKLCMSFTDCTFARIPLSLMCLILGTIVSRLLLDIRFSIQHNFFLHPSGNHLSSLHHPSEYQENVPPHTLCKLTMSSLRIPRIVPPPSLRRHLRNPSVVSFQYTAWSIRCFKMRPPSHRKVSSVCLSVCLSVYPSVCLSVCLSVCQSVRVQV